MRAFPVSFTSFWLAPSDFLVSYAFAAAATVVNRPCRSRFRVSRDQPGGGRADEFHRGFRAIEVAASGPFRASASPSGGPGTSGWRPRCNQTLDLLLPGKARHAGHGSYGSPRAATRRRRRSRSSAPRERGTRPLGARESALGERLDGRLPGEDGVDVDLDHTGQDRPPRTGGVGLLGFGSSSWSRPPALMSLTVESWRASSASGGVAPLSSELADPAVPRAGGVHPRRVRWWHVALMALVVVAVVGRFAVSLGLDTPWIAPDEMDYALLGRSFWLTGHSQHLDGRRRSLAPTRSSRGRRWRLSGPARAWRCSRDCRRCSWRSRWSRSTSGRAGSLASGGRWPRRR